MRAYSCDTFFCAGTFRPLQTTSDRFKPFQSTTSNHFRSQMQRPPTTFKRDVGGNKGIHHYSYNVGPAHRGSPSRTRAPTSNNGKTSTGKQSNIIGKKSPHCHSELDHIGSTVTTTLYLAELWHVNTLHLICDVLAFF